jgi:hypothetical protein
MNILSTPREIGSLGCTADYTVQTTVARYGDPILAGVFSDVPMVARATYLRPIPYYNDTSLRLALDRSVRR